MPAPVNDGKTKQHRNRKNPRSAELWRERKRALNAARPKQRWVSAAIDTGSDASPAAGYWTREPA
jgi:hypothetical protein